MDRQVFLGNIYVDHVDAPTFAHFPACGFRNRVLAMHMQLICDQGSGGVSTSQSELWCISDRNQASPDIALTRS